MKRYWTALAVLCLAVSITVAGITGVGPALLQGLVWSAGTAVPSAISHQGVVTVSGVRFTGNGLFRFALVAPGGSNLWTNDGSNIPGPGAPTGAVSLSVVDGIYSVALGDPLLANMTPVPQSVFSNDNVVLRVWFDDGSHGSQQLAPDHTLTSVPYAFRSATVNPGAIGTNELAAQAVDGTKLADNAVSTAKLADASVTSGKLAAEIAASLVPAGSIIATGRSTAPTGWLMCDGSMVSTTTYPVLFAALGYSYGGSGASFKLPDLRGRVPTGVDGAANRLTANDTLGASAGEEKHALTAAESGLPGHSHAVSDPGHGHGINDPGHKHTMDGDPGLRYVVRVGGTQNNYLPTSGQEGVTFSDVDATTTGISIQGSVTGLSVQSVAAQNAAQAHNVMQPYQVVNYIIKY